MKLKKEFEKQYLEAKKEFEKYHGVEVLISCGFLRYLGLKPVCCIDTLNWIIDKTLVCNKKSFTLKNLSSICQVSTQTLRRHLKSLTGANLIDIKKEDHSYTINLTDNFYKKWIETENKLDEMARNPDEKRNAR